MDKAWHILYCDESEQPCPVTEFIDRCAPKHQVKILRFLSLLEEMGPTLPRPYADTLHDGIHELRVKLSGDQIRLLYFFCYQKFIILYHGFVKTTDRVPEGIVRKVIQYRDKLLASTTPNLLEAVIDADL